MNALVEWARKFGKLPDNYLVMDCETTGLSPANDAITQVGWCSVKNRQVEELANRYVAWEKSEAKASDVANWRRNYATLLEKTEGQMPWPAWSTLQDQGSAARIVFEELASRIHEHQTIVGHNFAFFDLPFFRTMLAYCNVAVPAHFDRQSIVDTGMLVKAVVIGNTFPYANETRPQFNSRIGAIRTAGKWGLASAFVTSRVRYDRAKAHDAGFDCQITYQLLEKLRGECCDCGADRTGPSAEAHSVGCLSQ